LLFTAAKDKSPNVWFAHNGERLGTYEGHNGAIFSIDIDYNTRRFVSASADNTVKLWDASTGQEHFTWEFKTAARSVEFALGDREMLVLTDARMGNPGLLNVFPLANSLGSRASHP
jgi:translation initiation factor 3 subunit I